MAGHDYRSYTDVTDYSYGTSTALYTLSNLQCPSGCCGSSRGQDVGELAEKLEVQPSQVAIWKAQLLERSSEVFGEKSVGTPAPNIEKMEAKIGRFTLENDFLESALVKAGLLSAKR